MNIPTGYAQINLKFGGTALDGGGECTQALKLSDTDTDPGVIANSVITALTGLDMWGWTANEVSLDSVLVKFGPNETGPSAEVASSLSGTYSAGGVTPSTCYLIHKNTTLGGHAGKGRLYWPGVPEDEYENDGLINGASLAPLQVDVSTLFTVLNGIGDGLCLLHGDDSPISTPTLLTSYTVDPKIATQRRRLRR